MKRLSLRVAHHAVDCPTDGITCVAMNLLLCSSGVYYMTPRDSLQGGGTAFLE